jgi:hypothetical protein
MLILTMALALGEAPELLPMPRIADPGDLIRVGMTRKEVERLLPKQESRLVEYMLPGGFLTLRYPKSSIKVRYDWYQSVTKVWKY